MDPTKNTLTFKYLFKYENGESDVFTVKMDRTTKLLVPNANASGEEEWTKLENNKCSHCPLNSADTPHCPVAVNLSHLSRKFKDTKSHWKAKVVVESEDRAYFKNTDVQNGLRSIFGLIIAISACPSTEFLRTMALYHLPFANTEETLIRAIGSYLTKQYFVAKSGGQPDINLVGLDKNYEDLNKVNLGIINRIRSLGKGDSESNALVILDSFAQLLTMEISNDLSRLKPLFVNEG